MIKRAFDAALASAGLVILWPIFALVAIAIKLDSHGPVFFKQERIGRGFHPFYIYKFRTMTDTGSAASLVTVKGDPRITRIGRILRKTKIDELPQLINVLSGDMSFVGPRPEVRQYVDLFRKDYAEILRVQPGITDLASLKYRDEESVLAGCEDPHIAYIQEVLPDKIRMAKEYIRKLSFCTDMWIIFRTVLKLTDFDAAKSVSHVGPRIFEKSHNKGVR